MAYGALKNHRPERTVAPLAYDLPGIEWPCLPLSCRPVGGRLHLLKLPIDPNVLLHYRVRYAEANWYILANKIESPLQQEDRHGSKCRTDGLPHQYPKLLYHLFRHGIPYHSE